jgi:hypothetical protein
MVVSVKQTIIDVPLPVLTQDLYILLHRARLLASPSLKGAQS